MPIPYNVIFNSFSKTYSIFKDTFVHLLVHIATISLFFYFSAPHIKQSIVLFCAKFLPQPTYNFYVKVGIDLLTASIVGIWWLFGFTLAIRQLYLITKINMYDTSLVRHGSSFAKLLLSIIIALVFWTAAFSTLTITLIKTTHYCNITYHNDMREIHYLLILMSIFFLIARTLFVTPLIFKNHQGPLQALKTSWILTRKSNLKLIMFIMVFLAITNRGIRFIYNAQSCGVKLLITVTLLIVVIFITLLWLVIYEQITDRCSKDAQKKQNFH